MFSSVTPANKQFDRKISNKRKEFRNLIVAMQKKKRQKYCAMLHFTIYYIGNDHKMKTEPLKEVTAIKEALNHFFHETVST